MISTTSPATTRTKTTPPTVMAALPRYLSIRGSPDRETRRDSRHGLTRRPRRRALHDVLDPPTVGLSRQALEQPLQARRDGGARPVEVLADRGHVVPALHVHPRKGEVTEVARERHDAGGLRHVLRRHPPRSEPPQVDALLEEPRDDDRRDLGAGLGPGERRARPDAARAPTPRARARRSNSAAATTLFAAPCKHTKRTVGGLTSRRPTSAGGAETRSTQ